MKIGDARAMTGDEIEDKILELKKEQFNLRFQRATGQLANTARVRIVRRDIAQLMTIGREKKLGKDNVARLEEKWRFPRKGELRLVGAIHATPVVVNGYVYFGTATFATFYKLSPDGKVRWSYRRNPARAGGRAASESGKGDARSRNVRFQASPEGIMGSALVTEDTVFFGDVGGWFFVRNEKDFATRGVKRRQKP